MQLAQQADAVVMVMGLDQTQECEGMDRTIIAFPGVQDELITKVATCAAVRVQAFASNRFTHYCNYRRHSDIRYYRTSQ